MLGLFAAYSAIGCGGPSHGTVRGTVAVDGSPLSLGTIAFHADDGRAASAPINDGKYIVDKAPLGPAKITIHAHPPSPPMRKPMEAPAEGEAPLSASQLAAARAEFRPLPEKYHDKSTSGLSYTVQPGEQTHDMELAGK